MKAAAYLALCLCVPLSAHAQTANPWDGKWQVAFKTERGTDRDGTVTVAGSAGTWDLNVAQRNDPCAGRAYPIEVQRATAEELVFKVARSTALAGCQDNTMRLKPTDANTLEGTFMTRPFKMTKVN
ncbi:hypothetical protein QTH87_18545 [Variovorax sp. J22P168]|uniref:hypothetical protein n=1 Tax=Variovorax jilinensis TaxID=3053513 RepID=UPI002574D8B0|nr:hypothetical protein [Variovorax sp. J22P168]MDM0014447.1 hypothetical protein [Variovorax sp. J22P168]